MTVNDDNLIDNEQIVVRDKKYYTKFGITDEDLDNNNNPNSAWIVLNGKVFDVTEYAKLHPGGSIIY